ncbi:MAG: NAD(P)H-dependent oxidoreductase [Verrucomicrobiota bacterium]
MNTKRILILNGHPGDESLSRSLAESYRDAAEKAGHEVKIAHLSEMDFDSDFGGGGYRSTKPLEPELEALLSDLKWSEHVVMTTPIWWGGLPAKLKGLFDRILLPGEAFDTRNQKLGFPTPLLSGRTGRVLVTSDTPGWLMSLGYCNALFVQLRKQILGFVGIKPVRIKHFQGATKASSTKVEKWLAEAHQLGAAAA